MGRLRQAGSAFAACITAFSVMAGAAEAAAPVHATLEIDEARVPEEQPCGFPIEEHVEGTVRASFYFDSEANLTRMTFRRNLRLTFTNLANGETVEGHISSPEHVDLAEEGEHTVRITGLFGHLVVPGQGVVEHESGMVVLLTTGPGDPDPTIERLVGRLEGDVGPFPGLCDVLDGD